ncbi:hypothetical protein M409DRAFT_23051 [Zasmidium cellare ATCC 36951]|uniref:GA4 desaturase n=1 Tax=Zasmidium cellare ATCC 36951 TaxID=1080233 RepID=A0A6A6CH88_ZASCE|nr:uncharacterized protein M409DRAFT_23051 [Zasmidium cellare ATCC 36951]KAF2166411.1 hypothetical protein M409DRAFT_23051 [Zasmidium cellare ATCC 36951]
MTRGVLRFSIPDESIPAEERSLFATPQNKDFVPKEVELHDFCESSDVVQGPEGLHVQGFTYLRHKSKIIGSDQLFEGRNLDDIYLPEVERLMREVTGAKEVIVWSGVVRRKLPTHQENNPTVQHRKGGDLDKMIDSMPRDVPFIAGRDINRSVEPLRNVHIDFSNKGLRDTVRYCRHDFRKAGKAALDAEDAGSKNVPRYAAYSVWRPLVTVKRDPLAACDWRTVDQDGLYDADYRNPADNEKGEFMNNIRIFLPPKDDRQRWYYFSDQTPDDVLILKVGDTASDVDPEIASGCPHGSPMMLGTEGVEDPRQSIEVRVIAFW